MGAIVLLSRFRHQPQFPARIDWSNPIARGLTLAVTPAWGFANAVTGKLCTISGTVSRQTTGAGIALSVDGSAPSNYIETGVIPGGDVTMLFLGARMSSAAASGSQYVADVITSNTASEASHVDLNLGNAFGAGGDVDKPRVGNTAGTADGWIDGVRQSSTNPMDVPLVNGRIYSIVGRVTGGNVSTANYRLLGGIAGVYSVSVRATLLLAWDRGLSDPEVAALAMNPWQVFKPTTRRFWVAAPAVASVGSASGSSTVLGVGASLFGAVGSSSGVGTAAATGRSTAQSVAASAGVGTATGVSAAASAAVGASSGVGTATGIGAQVAAAVGSAAGVGTALAVSASTAAAVAASAGVGTALGVSTSMATSDGVGSAAGTATVLGVGLALAASTATSSGAATVTGLSSALVAGVGNAAGVATVTGMSGSAGTATAAAAGTSTVSGVGASLVSAVGTASGSAIVLGDAVGAAVAVGAAAGTSVVLGVGAAASVGSGVASAAGTSTVLGVSSVIFAAVGNAYGVGTALAYSSGVGSGLPIVCAHWVMSAPHGTWTFIGCADD